jgi:glycosyltransferase involved in cell wall biosynthesis
MRIMLVNNQVPSTVGGTETVVGHTERLLARDGHETALFAIRQADASPTPWDSHLPTADALQGRALRCKNSLAAVYSFETRTRLGRLVERFRPDVVHLHNVYEKVTFSVVDALRRRGVPTVLTLHDYRAICPNGLLLAADGLCHRCLGRGLYWHAIRHRCLKGPVTRTLKSSAEASLNRLRRQYQRVDAVVAPSRFMMQKLCQAELSTAPVHFIPNPVELAPIGPRPPLGVPVRFLFFGRLVPEKGLDILLTASRFVDPGIRITVAGGGPMAAHVASRVGAATLPVDVVGQLDRRGIAHQLQSSTAALVPSLWYENCPLSILEAHASALPVIASNLGGMGELVTDGGDGLLVPPGDPGALACAMNSLARDPETTRQLGLAGRRRVGESNSPERYLENLMHCYGTAMGHGASYGDNTPLHAVADEHPSSMNLP